MNHLAIFLIVSMPAFAHAACDEAKLAKLEKYLGGSDGHYLDADAVAGELLSACTLPTSLGQPLRRALSGGLRDLGRRAALEAVIADPALWARACPGGQGVLNDIAQSYAAQPSFGRREHAQMLWFGCRIGALDIAGEEEWARAGATAELTLLLLQWMREEKFSPSRIRAYSRVLADFEAPEESDPRHPIASPSDTAPHATERLGVGGEGEVRTTRDRQDLAPDPLLEVTIFNDNSANKSVPAHTKLLAEHVRTFKNASLPCFEKNAVGSTRIFLHVRIFGGAAHEEEVLSRVDGTNDLQPFADAKFNQCLLAHLARTTFANAPETVTATFALQNIRH